MKMRWMAVSVVALLASACGGAVEESTDAYAQHANVDPVAVASLQPPGETRSAAVLQPPPEDQLVPKCDVRCSPGYYCCFENMCCAGPSP